MHLGPLCMKLRAPDSFFSLWKICAILREKTPFLAFPEAKKGVVNYVRLRKAAHWPNNNANPSALSEKKVYCVESLPFCR